MGEGERGIENSGKGAGGKGRNNSDLTAVRLHVTPNHNRQSVGAVN